VKIVLTTSGHDINAPLNSRFGRSPKFLVYDLENGAFEVVGNQQNLNNNVDILDGTPLLDIKPYTARFDRIDPTRNGWQDEVTEEAARRRGRRGYAG
jgi:hypothetical protein